MKQTDVIVIGGGLAGLQTAKLVAKLGLDFRLFEAKPLLGGRVSGVPCHANNLNTPQFYDLGPTWVFPHHTRVQTLSAQYGLPLFDQYNKGDVLYQFENIKEPRKISGGNAQSLYRVEGGMYSLVRAISAKLDTQKLYSNYKVAKIARAGDMWRIQAIGKSGKLVYTAKHLIFAIPPRILSRDFEEAPFMTPQLRQQLNRSQTWMSAQAKLVITYSKPFWREKGYSGQAFSQTGPLVEIHDACTSEDFASDTLDENNTNEAGNQTGYALCGFIGMAATLRMGESQKVIKQSCIRQLAAIFGQQAYKFEKCFLKDWAKDTDICTGQDQSEGSRHPNFEIYEFEDALNEQNVYLAGSEFAREEAGYLEGALNAAHSAVSLIEDKI